MSVAAGRRLDHGPVVESGGGLPGRVVVGWLRAWRRGKAPDIYALFARLRAARPVLPPLALIARARAFSLPAKHPPQVRVWEMAKDAQGGAASAAGKLEQRSEGGAPLLDLAWRDDDSAIFFAGADHAARMMPLANPAAATTVAAHEAPIRHVAWVKEVRGKGWRGLARLLRALRAGAATGARPLCPLRRSPRWSRLAGTAPSVRGTCARRRARPP